MMLSETDKIVTCSIYKCYCWQRRKIICISNSEFDSEAALQEQKKASKGLEILTPLNLYREEASSSWQREKNKKKPNYPLLTRATSKLLTPQFNNSNNYYDIFLWSGLTDQESLSK